MQAARKETERRPTRPPPLFVYAAAVLASSTLVFWIQPLAVRGLLPAVGGSPLMWNTAMLFFQGALLAGYLLAHAMQRRLPETGQMIVLGCVWLAAMISAWTGGFGHLLGEAPPQTGVVLPVLWILGTLAATYGMGCLAVSTATPLVSSWLARAQDTVDPYILYAVSNLGSIGILILYPFVLEPLLGVHMQLQLWQLVLGPLLALLLWLVARAPERRREGEESAPRAAAAGLPMRAACRVVVLSLLPSALLYGVTLRLSSDVVATPLLWVLPLALYLGTYVLAFGRRQFFGRFGVVLSSVVVPSALVLFAAFQGFTGEGLLWGVFHLAVFGLTAFWLHGLLWERRPPSGDLTRFYVLIACGGLLGGLMSVLVFPLVFPDVWEYPVLFALAALWLPKGAAALSRPAWAWAGGAAGTGGAVAAILILCVPGGPSWLRLAAAAVLAASVPGLWTLRQRPWMLSAALLLVSLAPVFAWTFRGGEVLALERTWFGIYRVMDMASQEGLPGRVRLFVHGRTLHGFEWLKEPGMVESRTGYYAPEGPYGDVMGALRRRQGSLRLGVVGLGTGGLLCYAEPGDAVTVYEIDAAVVSLARSHFRPLDGCAPEASVKVGDGRLSISKEAPGTFDALFLDAFSSASIPVHLLTVEAFAEYLRVLAPGGVMAVHISNRHLDLEQLVGLAAGELGLAGAVRLHEAAPWSADGPLPLTTHLVVLAR
ncbi:MAG: fused MFS/spermidine synthase, partial [Candidatus Tectomicrobia bacterium]|nr:fused MFS/spermidine synthase [Candidatus Tectomicrobia bacterium]